MALFTHLLTSLFPLLASFPTEVSGQMLYALHRGEVEKAFEGYISYAEESQSQDFALLQQAAKALLEKGIASKDQEIELLCMFGAGVATSSEMIPLLERGLFSEEIRTQLIALSYLARLQDDAADRLLHNCLSSPLLLIRLEALLHLAERNNPSVIGHLLSLMPKVPVEIKPLFSQIAIHIEGGEGNRFLRQMLADPDLHVRVEAIQIVAEAGRDDFLPAIRTLALGASYLQQESCALAFGLLKDHLSIDKLKEWATSRQESVSLAATISLYQLGEISYLSQIEEAAKKGSLFAISALGTLQEGKETLAELLHANDRDVRINAILSLLKSQDRRALSHLEEILIEDLRDTAFWKVSSPCGGLKAWKTIPSGKSQEKSYPGILGQTLALREEVLIHCLEFEERVFLSIARRIFQKREQALVPIVIELLENKKSEHVIQFLKEGCQRAGAPLIRNYCTLALYRLNEEGPYEEQLISWIKASGSEELIRFKEENEKQPLIDSYQLNPEETSRFLIDVCEALASAQNQSGIFALIHTIAHGNPKNRYALAGLLMRTTE